MFPHHPRSSAAIEALAKGLQDECAELDRLAAATPEPTWDGAGCPSVRRHTDRIMGRVLEIAESIQDYGEAVADYDDRVDRLNARWLAEHARDFGVPPPQVDEAASPAQVAAADQAHADRVWRARVDLVRSLRAEYERVQAELLAAGQAFDRANEQRPDGA